MLREHIELVHGHAGLSALAQEAMLHAHHMNIRTVFTDHSLFGFADAASILTNKLLEVALKNVDAVICVSYTGLVAFCSFFQTTKSFSEIVFFFTVGKIPCLEQPFRVLSLKQFMSFPTQS